MVRDVIYEVHVGLVGGYAGVQTPAAASRCARHHRHRADAGADFAGPRNWGYDGVLPFAPEASYGTPDELKALIDAAHGHGLMVFLDVVYNHFGPDGNYIGVYADAFFRDDIKTPWGRAIDFRKREVRDFFANNALYWLQEFRFDGLRLDATHSIVPQDWLEELSGFLVDAVDAARHVHLVIEHEGNAAHLLGPHKWVRRAMERRRAPRAARAADRRERRLLRRLRGPTPADKLARCLSEGFVYQGQPSIFRQGVRRGEPSKDLPPTAFVMFLQNHDQIGNRAFGERLTTLADPAAHCARPTRCCCCARRSRCCSWARSSARRSRSCSSRAIPTRRLAEAVREGRRGEFAGARGFADPAVRHTIPDPNSPSTFEASRPCAAWSGRGTREPTRRDTHSRASIACSRCAHAHIVPRLEGTRSLGAEAVGPAAVIARWHMGDGAVLTIAVNLGPDRGVDPGPSLPPARDAAPRHTGARCGRSAGLPARSRDLGAARSRDLIPQLPCRTP